MTTQTMQTTPSWVRRREFRNYLAISSITLFGLMVISVFLMPLAYMSLTAFKDYQQGISLDAAILPMQPTTFNYNGQDYPLKRFLINGTVRELALVEKFNDESNFIDPAN